VWSPNRSGVFAAMVASTVEVMFVIYLLLRNLA